MKRQRRTIEERAGPPPGDTDSDEEPQQAPLQAPAGKRSRMVPVHHSDDSGSGSESEEESSSGSEGEDGEGEEGLPLGQLVALRQDGSTTPAAMKARARALRQDKAAGRQRFKREGKHRPVEMSSKRPVPVLREALPGGKREVRDPRFESLSAGQYDESKFKKRYSFLYDEKMPEEREELRAALKKTKGQAARTELQARLTRVEQQLRSEEARRKRETFKQQVKAKERTAVEGGKRPFYLKKSEQRRLELLAKYEELQASGKLDKFLEKRRKKNAAKDHRYLPSTRRQAGGED